MVASKENILKKKYGQRWIKKRYRKVYAIKSILFENQLETIDGIALEAQLPGLVNSLTIFSTIKTGENIERKYIKYYTLKLVACQEVVKNG